MLGLHLENPSDELSVIIGLVRVRPPKDDRGSNKMEHPFTMSPRLRTSRTGSNASRWPKQASNSRQSSAALWFMHMPPWSGVKRLTPGNCSSVDSVITAWR